MDGVPIIGLTAPTLLLIVVLLLLRGDILSRRVHRELMDVILDDRNEWRTQAKLSEAARAMQDQQILELLEISRTTAPVIQAIASHAANSKAD